MNIDLHNHVVPQGVVDAIRRSPERFGTRIEDRNGQLYFDAHGRMIPLLAMFYDIDAKIEWMDRTVKNLTPEELVDGARQVAAYKRELTADVQAKTKALKDSKDEAAIRAAQQSARSQRSKISST